MNNLYVRLAKNNLKNNKSLYVPYMVAGMITVLMFYIMMFINNSAGLEKMRGAFYLSLIHISGKGENAYADLWKQCCADDRGKL